MASQGLILCFSTAAEIAGNLAVKKKAAHMNPEAPGAPELTKLERGGHFVQRNLIYVGGTCACFPAPCALAQILAGAGSQVHHFGERFKHLAQ